MTSKTLVRPDNHEAAKARIAECVREIEIICDEFGYDQTEWLITPDETSQRRPCRLVADGVEGTCLQCGVNFIAGQMFQCGEWQKAPRAADKPSPGLPSSATAPHAHTDECWEPDSGCDMGRNAEFARTVPRLCPRCNRNWISGEEACDCDGPPSTVSEKP